MRTYIAYTIWNKQDHVAWIMRGINYFIPKGSMVHFILDHCDDQTAEQVAIHAEKYMVGYDFLCETSTETNRWQCTNVALKRFLLSDCELFISPQDDQKIQDSKLIKNLLYFNHDNIGIIGMRDGLNKSGDIIASCHHSIVEPPEKTQWLTSGDGIAVDVINDGPVALFRETVAKVGMFDVENFHAFYTEYDYALRCQKAGLTNYVMGADIVHEKFGKVSPSQYYNDGEMSAHDMNSLRRKHQW